MLQTCRRWISPLENRVRPREVVTQRERCITFHGRLLTERYRMGVRRSMLGARATTSGASRRGTALPDDRMRPYSPHPVTTFRTPRSAGCARGSPRVGAVTHLARQHGRRDPRAPAASVARWRAGQSAPSADGSRGASGETGRASDHTRHTTDQHHGLNTKGLRP